MGAHTDYGIVTVLWADPILGLQILDVLIALRGIEMQRMVIARDVLR